MSEGRSQMCHTSNTYPLTGVVTSYTHNGHKMLKPVCRKIFFIYIYLVMYIYSMSIYINKLVSDLKQTGTAKREN